MDAYLDSIAETAGQLHAAGLFEADRVPMISAGGSSYFDQVVVIVGFGRRDVPFDDQLPVVLGRYGHDGQRGDLPSARVTKLNDQHAYLEVPENLPVGVGEVWSFGVSDPCGAFDRWPAIPLVDDSHQVTSAVTTDLC